MGAVCKKHEEFYEKACRWCVPEEIKGPSAAAAPPIQRGTPVQWVAQECALNPRWTPCFCGQFCTDTTNPEYFFDAGGVRHAQRRCST